MRNACTIFHRINSVHLEKNLRHGGWWADITITDSEGSTHEISCFPADGPLSITFGPDNIPIDDKLVSK